MEQQHDIYETMKYLTYILLFAFPYYCNAENQLNIIGSGVSEVTGRGTGLAYEIIGTITGVTPPSPPVIPEAWVLEVTTTDDSQSFRIDYYDASDIVIDWGDGNTNNVSGSSSISHTYSILSTNEVQITGGSASRISLGATSPSRTRLTRIKYPLRGISGISSFLASFRYTTNLKDIPDDMFRYCTNAITFGGSSTGHGAFEGSAITNIPAGLFDYNIAATHFERTFYESDITEIPSGLFDSNTNAVSFLNCFSKAPITEVPAGLFNNNSKVESFAYLFAHCTVLSTVPQGIFDYNTNVTSFGYTFYNCQALDWAGPIVGDGEVELWERDPEPTHINFATLANETFRAIVPVSWGGTL